MTTELLTQHGGRQRRHNTLNQQTALTVFVQSPHEALFLLVYEEQEDQQPSLLASALVMMMIDILFGGAGVACGEMV